MIESWGAVVESGGFFFTSFVVSKIVESGGGVFVFFVVFEMVELGGL